MGTGLVILRVSGPHRQCWPDRASSHSSPMRRIIESLQSLGSAFRCGGHAQPGELGQHSSRNDESLRQIGATKTILKRRRSPFGNTRRRRKASQVVLQKDSGLVCPHRCCLSLCYPAPWIHLAGKRWRDDGGVQISGHQCRQWAENNLCPAVATRKPRSRNLERPLLRSVSNPCQDDSDSRGR